MFFFSLRGQNLGVKFYRNGTTTYAELCRLDGKEVSETNILGIATLGVKDRMVKKIGRKVALAKLFERMNEISAGYDAPEFPLSKEEREEIWRTYFNQFKK